MPATDAPLSFSQQRLWFLDQLTPGHALYNLPLALDVDGPLDVETLRRALDEIVRRHEPLRTVFPSVGGRPYQDVLAHQAFELPVEDLTHLSADDQHAAIDRRIVEEVRRPFDLTTGPLIRASLLRSDSIHVLVLVVHHISFDGWSTGVFFRELTALYDAYGSGRLSPLPELPIRYIDFARRQHDWLGGESCQRQSAYWQEQLKAPHPVLALPTDRPRPATRTHLGQSHHVMMSDALMAAVQEFSQRQGVTVFMTILAAYVTFLHRLTGQEDLVIGTPIANRTDEDIEPLIGFFANSLALRFRVSESATFIDLVTQAKRVALGAYANQDLPFEAVVEELNPERTLTHTPIVQTFIVFDNNRRAVRGIGATGDVFLRRRPVTTGTSKFDMTLFVRRAVEGWRTSLESSTDLFDPATGSRMLREFCGLVESVLDDPTRPIDRVVLLNEDDRRQVTVDWNATAAPYPRHQTIVDLVEGQAARTPDADALLWGEQRLSYGKLNARANMLARALRSRGVGADDRVGICLNRSADLVVAMLAVLKAGAAYVPLDPMYPRNRLMFVSRDARCSLLVTERALGSLVGTPDLAVLFVDANDWQDPGLPDGNLEPVARPDHLAYVMYTSGSTGEPKGVAVEHRSVVNLVSWALVTFSRGELSGMLASTSVSFDLSVFEIFVPLSCGGMVVLVNNLLGLPEAYARTRVTFINTVPSVMRQLLLTGGVPSSVSVVALAGEPLHQSLVAHIYQSTPARKVFDLYGPTETTVYATCALRTADGPATIGRPIANTIALVLDSWRQPVPIGVTGELYIGGDGLAREYLGRPELTRERFVDSPTTDGRSGRLYRTGDDVRWRADGTLEFVGRSDRQVKLRGFRIELGEVESALLEHPSIGDAVVLLREERPGDAQLRAFIVEREACHDDHVYWHLEQRLPHFMVPATITRVPQLPRLPNGKIDQGALQPPLDTPRNQPLVLPRTPTEEGVAAIWREVLNQPQIGVDDHFFRLGGHSLLSTQVVSRLNRRYGAGLEVDAVFRFPTIAEQARLVEERVGGAGRAPVPGREVRGEGVSDAIRTQLLGWAGQRSAYPRDRTVVDLFERQAADGPDQTAVVSDSDTLTYRQLNERANRLARYLRTRMTAETVSIGVCLERSVDSIVTLLAIVKAGAAYVPLDPAFPPARLALLADRANLRFVIACRDTCERLADVAAAPILIDRDRDAIAAESPGNLECRSRPEAPAYVLFTSGSTGEPKGVAVSHRAIVRLVYGLPELALGAGQTVMHLAPLAFDAATFEIWGPLLRGGRLAVAPAHLSTLNALEAFVAAHDVTVMWLTASLFNAVIDDRPQALARIRDLLIGGEVLSVPHVRRALSELPGTRIINGYGPTETTTFACSHIIRAEDVEGRSIPIGRPLLNTRVYVLDADRQLLPPGEAGELWIGGDGVACGYLNNEALTTARFVPDPFVADADARMYGTGDRVRFLPSGALEFLGRFDDQIKVRGFRIEPGEVEAMLLQHPGVSRAVVGAVDMPPKGRVLVAFVVAAAATGPGGRSVPVSELRDVLKQRLPDHMVPSRWVFRDAFPLLPTGKTDRRAVLALPLEPVVAPEQSPASSLPPTLESIAAIWRSVLGVAYVGIDDDFFDLGGHSLLATQVLSRIQSTLGVEIDLRTLFSAPTVAALARAVEDASRSAVAPASPIARTSRAAPLPLSFAQQRIWFLQQWYSESGVYNVPSALRIVGALDIGALTRALQAIVDRHEALRTVFPLTGERPVQRVADHLAVALSLTDLTALPSGDAEAVALAQARDEARRPFDLVMGPLMRSSLVRVTEEAHLLLVVFHHIVVDGWSIGIFFRELQALYAAETTGEPADLTPLPVHYADFAVWQRQHVTGAVLDRHLSYWRRQMNPPPASLDMPLDRPRPPETTARGGRVPVLVSPELTSALARMGSEENATLFVLLLSAYQALLHRYTGQDDVCVGTPVANRIRQEVEPLIGCFVNTLAIRVRVADDLTFRQLVQMTRNTTIDAQVHQDLPFELLVDALQIPRSADRAPVFQAMFALQEGLSRPLELPGLTISSVPVAFDFAKFELTLDLRRIGTEVRGSLEYNTDLFDRQTVQRFVDDFTDLLGDALRDPDCRLADIPLAGAEERRRQGPPTVPTPAAGTDTMPSRRAHPDEVTAIEDRLTVIWQGVLDVPRVAPTDNFFEIGGNSLLAIRLFTDVEAVFGVRLPLSALFRSGTIHAQACLLATASSAEDETPIVPIQPLGTHAPFFLVHGIGGEVLSFQALAQHLGADQPMYGLRAVGHDDAARDSRIEDVAAHYVEALLRVAPSGPYHLGGYSSGGVIAYEMAQQLHDAGHEMALLAMLDAPAPGVRPAPLTPETMWRIVKNTAYWPLDDAFFRSGWTAQRARVGAKLRAIQARRAHRRGSTTALGAGADVRDLLGLWKMPARARGFLERYVRMTQAYRPRPYRGRISVFCARTPKLGYRGTRDLGWRTLAQGGVAVHVVPGAHDTILEEPRVRGLAAALARSLQAS